MVNNSTPKGSARFFGSHIRLLTIAVLLFAGLTSFGQIAGGTYAIPGSYATISAAVNALNLQGISGPVIFNCAGNGGETAPNAGILLGSATLNATSNSTNTITFKTAGGTDYKITAGTGQGAYDFIFGIQGTGYVTIKGIDLADAAGNNTPTKEMEYGYAFFTLNATTPLDASQNCDIENCTITLNNSNTNAANSNVMAGSSGIFVEEAVASAPATLLTPLAAGDAFSYNNFYGNTISGVTFGIYVAGNSSGSYPDLNNNIGGSSSAQGNTIQNMQTSVNTSANPEAGIFATGQTGLNVTYNSINNLDFGAASTTAGSISGTTFTAPAGTVTGTFAANQVLSGSAVTSGTAIVQQLTAASYPVTSTGSSISGYTLTVGTVTAGTFASGDLIGGTGVTGGTTIVQQLTSTAASIATVTGSIAVYGTVGVLTVTAASVTGLAPGQLISGGQIIPGTYIIRDSTGSGGTGLYVVNYPVAVTSPGTNGIKSYAQGGPGTYEVSASQTVASTAIDATSALGGAGTYQVNNSQSVSSETISTESACTGLAVGIWVGGNASSTYVVSNNTLNLYTASNGVAAGGSNNDGIYAPTLGALTLNNNNINFTQNYVQNSAANTPAVSGVLTYGGQTLTGLSASGNTINIVQKDSLGSAYGFNTEVTGTITISGNTVNVTNYGSSTTKGEGIAVLSSTGTISITGNTVNGITGNSEVFNSTPPPSFNTYSAEYWDATMYGIYYDATGALTVSGNSISMTANTVPTVATGQATCSVTTLLSCSTASATGNARCRCSGGYEETAPTYGNIYYIYIPSTSTVNVSGYTIPYPSANTPVQEAVVDNTFVGGTTLGNQEPISLIFEEGSGNASSRLISGNQTSGNFTLTATTTSGGTTNPTFGGYNGVSNTGSEWAYITGNNFSNISSTSELAEPIGIAIGAENAAITNNVISNWRAATTNQVYGIYTGAPATGITVINDSNTVSGINAGSNQDANGLVGIYGSATSIAYNNVNNLSVNSGTAAGTDMNGIEVGSPVGPSYVMNINNNKIYDLVNSGTGTVGVAGIYADATAINGNVNIYNNVIDSLYAPFSIDTPNTTFSDYPNVMGMYLENVQSNAETGPLSTVSGTTLTIGGDATAPNTVTTTYAVGQYIYGAGIPAGTQITALGTNSGTGSISGTTLTITAVTSGAFGVNQIITGGTITGGTKITAVGTFTFTGSISGTTLTVTAAPSPYISVGQALSGGSLGGQYITAQTGGAAGGVGTYTISANLGTIASETITATSTGGPGNYTVNTSQTAASTAISSTSAGAQGNYTISNSANVSTREAIDVAGNTVYFNVYYNTIFLADEAGTSYGGAGDAVSAGIYAPTAGPLLLQNNIVINDINPPGTGYAVAFYKAINEPYSNLSNNNNFYAGTPGARNLIYYDGTNAKQTIAQYKTYMATLGNQDQNSLTENTLTYFLSTQGGAANFLQLNNTASANFNAGLTPPTYSAFVTAPGTVNTISIPTDYFGIIRAGSAGYLGDAAKPTIGASEILDVYVWSGPTSTAWATATNWTSNVVPPNACASNIYIPAGTPFSPTLSSAQSVGNVKIDATAKLTLNANLSACGNWVGGSASNAIVSSNGGIVILDGSATQFISNQTQFSELKLDNTAGAVMHTSTSVTIDTALDLEVGAFDADSGTLTFTSTSPTQIAIIDNFSAGNSGTLTGSITAQRYYNTSSTYEQHMLGSPVSAPPLSQFGASGTAGFVVPKSDCDESQMYFTSPYGTLFSYRESNPPAAVCGMAQWDVVTAGNATNGVGYSFRKAGSGILSLSGTANLNTSYTVSGLTNSNWSNTSLQGRHMSSGWALLSNPYLATLNLTTANSGFDNQIQVWNDSGSFAGTYQPGTIGSSAIVAPFQGFMVHKTNAGGSLSYLINASNRTRNAAQFFSQNDNELNIVAQNTATGLLDQTTVAFNSSANPIDGFDPQLDADKLAGSLNRHTLYTTNGQNTDRWLSVNVLNSIASTGTVPLGFEPGVSGNYQLNFNGLNTFDPTTYIMLEDKKLNVMYDVRNGSYSFTSDASDNWDRFVLHFTPPAIINSANATCVNPGTISITQPGTANWNYTLTDAGQAVISSGVLNQGNPVSVNVQAGNYILTLTDNNNYTVTKAIQVNGAPDVVAGFNVSSNNATAQADIQFTNTSQNAGSVIWNFGDGTTSTSASTTHAYAAAGTYTVTLTASSISGCSATASQTIKVTGTATGISNITNGNITMWSNENRVYVDFTQLSNVNAIVRIYDILGRQISNEKFTSNVVYQKELNNIDAQYVIISVLNGGSVETKKLFITNTGY